MRSAILFNKEGMICEFWPFIREVRTYHALSSDRVWFVGQRFISD